MQRDRGYHLFADDGAFAFGSRRDIELGALTALILCDHCVRSGMMRHTAGKTVAMYFGQPVVNLREFLPDEAIRPIKMGDGEAPVVPEFKHLRVGSMLSKNFDDSVTIMARIRLVRIAFTYCKRLFFGTTRRRVAAQQGLSLRTLLTSRSCSRCFCMARNAGVLLLRTRGYFSASTGGAFASCAGSSLATTVTLGSIASRPRNWRRSWASTTSGIMFTRGC